MFKWLKKLWGKKRELEEGQMFDLRKRSWGHNVEFEEKDKKIANAYNIHGWLTPHIKVGDTFLFPATKGLAVWQLIQVKNCNDPSDMFFGKAGIIRYATEKDINKITTKIESIEEKVGFRFV